MYLARNHEELSKHVKFSVTNDVKVYELLENKWDTFNLMERLGIFTPETEILDQFDHTKHDHQYPFFLKIASGTNAGRGVWLCKNDHDLQEALSSKEIKNNTDVLLIKQTPKSGDIICGQAIYDQGNPVGYFFTKSVQSDNLAGMSDNYIRSQSSEVKDMISHVKVELTDSQWENIHDIFMTIGNETKYNGMIDIEFILSEEGICLLECNPRFSGALHTTLSNVGFLDRYFGLVMNQNNDEMKTIDDKAELCGNYSAGVEMKARVGDFSPAAYYAKQPIRVLSLRQWETTIPTPNSIIATIAKDRDSFDSFGEELGETINSNATWLKEQIKDRDSFDSFGETINSNATWLKEQMIPTK